MFTVVQSFDTLPVEANEGELFFCSLESTVYAYSNNIWVSYEEFVGGFEEIASVTSTEFNTNTEAFVFNDAPFFEEYRLGYLYPVQFTANSLVSNNDFNFDFTIVADTGIELVHSSAKQIFYPNIVSYYFINQDINNNLNETVVNSFDSKTYSAGFNVKASNITINGPITLSLFKPIGV